LATGYNRKAVAEVGERQLMAADARERCQRFVTLTRAVAAKEKQKATDADGIR
jgi:hypothetical protein